MIRYSVDNPANTQFVGCMVVRVNYILTGCWIVVLVWDACELVFIVYSIFFVNGCEVMLVLLAVPGFRACKFYILFIHYPDTTVSSTFHIILQMQWVETVLFLQCYFATVCSVYPSFKSPQRIKIMIGALYYLVLFCEFKSVCPY